MPTLIINHKCIDQPGVVNFSILFPNVLFNIMTTSFSLAGAIHKVAQMT